MLIEKYMTAILATAVFIGGYALIAMEHRFHLHKAVTAMLLGSMLWVLIAIWGKSTEIEGALGHIGEEIFSLIAFLLAAMTLVEILVHYRFFDLIRAKIQKLGLVDAKQLWLLSGVAFFLSAIIDNLTTTIVMVQIARRFFKGNNLLIAGAAIVIAANAGGAFSPIGDITTIMLWLAKKFTAGEVMAWGFMPALGLMLTSVWLLAGKVKSDTEDSTEDEEKNFQLTRAERIVIGAALLSFTFPVLAHMTHLPPYLGLIFGLGIVGTLMSFFARAARKRETHLSADIERLLKSVDYASILFFVGILLAVGALRYLGILSGISGALFGANPEIWRLIGGDIVLGILSAIVDNIPLTAAAIDILSTTETSIWVLLALTAGTGGSLLVIGSAAGVVAMGMIKELSFKKYFQIATWPAFAGYAIAIVIWYGQYLLFS